MERMQIARCKYQLYMQGKDWICLNLATVCGYGSHLKIRQPIVRNKELNYTTKNILKSSGFMKYTFLYMNTSAQCSASKRHFQRRNNVFSLSHPFDSVSTLCLWKKIISISLIGNPKQRQTFHLRGNYLVQKLFHCSLICATKTFRCPRFDLAIQESILRGKPTMKERDVLLCTIENTGKPQSLR